jgi:mono/diheme cytochrome c family protein
MHLPLWPAVKFSRICLFTLILLAAGCSSSADSPIQVEKQHPHPIESNQEQHSSGDPEIQFLGRGFNESEIEEGHLIYTQYCAACHGIDGQGQYPEAPFEPDRTGRIGAPPHDDTGHTWHHSDVLLIRYVTEGGFTDPERFHPMPPFGNILSDEQIVFVIAYIKTMWTDEQRVMQRRLTEEEQRMFD